MSLSDGELEGLVRGVQSVDEANCGRWMKWGKLEPARLKLLVGALVDAYEELLVGKRVVESDVESALVLDPESVKQAMEGETLLVTSTPEASDEPAWYMDGKMEILEDAKEGVDSEAGDKRNIQYVRDEHGKVMFEVKVDSSGFEALTKRVEALEGICAEYDGEVEDLKHRVDAFDGCLVALYEGLSSVEKRLDKLEECWERRADRMETRVVGMVEQWTKDVKERLDALEHDTHHGQFDGLVERVELLESGTSAKDLEGVELKEREVVLKHWDHISMMNKDKLLEKYMEISCPIEEVYDLSPGQCIVTEVPTPRGPSLFNVVARD